MEGEVITKEQAEAWKAEMESMRHHVELTDKKRGEWISWLLTGLGTSAIIGGSFVVAFAALYACAQLWDWTVSL